MLILQKWQKWLEVILSRRELCPGYDEHSLEAVNGGGKEIVGAVLVKEDD